MLRLILLILAIYLLWRLFRILIPILRQIWYAKGRKIEDQRGASSPKGPMTFTNVKDADFEELPNEPTPKKDKKPT